MKIVKIREVPSIIKSLREKRNFYQKNKYLRPSKRWAAKAGEAKGRSSVLRKGQNQEPNTCCSQEGHWMCHPHPSGVGAARAQLIAEISCPCPSSHPQPCAGDTRAWSEPASPSAWLKPPAQCHHLQLWAGIGKMDC